MAPFLLQGIVTKVGFMNKTATVSVSRYVTHPRTKKRLERTKKYLAHDPNNELRMLDEVTIKNVPPISARKRFALYKVLRSPDGERDRRHQREKEAAAASASASAIGKSLETSPPPQQSAVSSTEQSAHA